MKRTVCAAALALILASCGGDGGKKFNPADRVATSDTTAAAPRHLSPAELLTDSMAVKLSVLPPALSEIVTQDVADDIALRLMQMVTSQGIGCFNTAPGFAVGARPLSADVKATGTTPQKYLANISVVYEIVNTLTGDVYATTRQELTGAGNSSRQAIAAAFNDIKITPEFRAILEEGKSRIVKWFEQSLPTFKGQVESSCAQGNYSLALAFVESVPAEAREAYDYANSVRPQILDKFKTQVAEKELTAMMSAITRADGTYSADVYAHMMMLPEGSSQYARAQKCLADYEKQVKDTRRAQVSAQQAAAEREQQMQLAKVNADLTKAKYQAEASSQAIRLSLIERHDRNRGLWSSIGYRILGMFDEKSGDGFAGPSLNDILNPNRPVSQ